MQLVFQIITKVSSEFSKKKTFKNISNSEQFYHYITSVGLLSNDACKHRRNIK